MIVKAIIIAVVGIAWVGILRIDHRSDALERIVLGVCLSVAYVIFVGSSIILARLPFQVARYVVPVFAAALIGIWLCFRPKVIPFAGQLREVSRYWLPAALLVFHFALWSVFLVNYPYFPNTGPPDALWHAEITLSVLQGVLATPIAQAGFPAGAHILFAFVTTYFDVSVLTAERVTAALVESLSVLIAYCLFQRILPSKRSADYASVAFAVIIPAGLVYYARMGAYPNIIGDFFVLASMLLVLLVQEELTLSSFLTVILVEGVTLIAHLSAVIFALLVILFATVVFERFRPNLRQYLISMSGFFLLPVVAVLAAPLLVARELEYISFNYLQIPTDLAVYSQVWLHNFLALPGPMNLLLILAGVVWVLAKTRKYMWSVFLVTWFGFLCALVFFSTFGERLILLSFIPGAGLMGLVLAEIHVAMRKMVQLKIRPRWLGRISVGVFMLVLVATLAVQGPALLEVRQSVAPGQAERQRYLYESMTWIETNTPRKASVISVGLLIEYRYLTIITNRSYVGDFQLDSDHILKLRTCLNFNYIVVSTDFVGLPTFYNSNTLHALYQNPDAAIFTVTADS